MPTADFTIADKLREARNMLRKDGAWIQGSFSDRCGGHCAAGAILEVLGNDEGDARHAVFDALFRAIPRVNSSTALWVWNDRQRRTQAEVLAAFDKAIELAEAEQ
jgi:hypothetical protein